MLELKLTDNGNFTDTDLTQIQYETKTLTHNFKKTGPATFPIYLLRKIFDDLLVCFCYFLCVTSRQEFHPWMQMITTTCIPCLIQMSITQVYLA